MMENRQPPPTFVELRSRLFSHEQRLKRSSRSAHSNPSIGDTALVAAQIPQRTQNFRGRGRGNILQQGNDQFSHSHNYNRGNFMQQQGNGPFPHSHNYNRGRAQNFQGNRYMGKCQICHAQGHSAAKCRF